MTTPLTLEQSNVTTVTPQFQTLSAAEERMKVESEAGPLRFSLRVEQQPKQSRMCGVGEKNNRRPIDPPPAVQVTLADLHGHPVTYPMMDTAFFFIQVVLVHCDTLQPVVVPARERQMTPLVGVTNTTLHRINVPVTNNPGAVESWGVFAFTDLSVRQEGDYRLQFNLYEIMSGEAHHRARTESDRFHVYAAKGFPGMEQSTPFTDLLKKHGIRVRVSKSIRATKKFTTKVPDSTFPKFDPEDHEQQRLLMNPNLRNYDPDAMRDVEQYDHRRRESNKYEPYDTGMYPSNNSLQLPAPILPPPNNAGPAPMGVAPAYSDRSEPNLNHRAEYGHSFYNQTSPVYPRPSPIAENSFSTFDKRTSDRSRTYDQTFHTNPYTPNPYPSPYSGSPSARQYSPGPSTSSTLSTTHHGPSRTTFKSPRIRHSEYRDSPHLARRRSSATQAHLPPIFNRYAPGGDQYKHVPTHTQTQDVRHVSHTERPNGMDYTGQQFQPPPPPPTQEQWYFSNNTGYGTGNEGYRGHGQ